MGWLAAGVALVLLGLMPVGVVASYDHKGATAALTVAFLRFRVYPRKRTTKKGSTPSEQNKDDFASEPKKGKRNGTLSDFLPILRLVLEFLSDFKRKLRIRNLQLQLILAGNDPADLAIHYGRACGSFANLMPHIERLFVIKKRDVVVACDFQADQTRINASIDMTIPLGRLLWISGYHGIRVFRKYKSILKQKKDGATL